MAEYTVQDYREAAQRALDAGNIKAAEELAQAGIRLQKSEAASKKEDRGIMDVLRENIIGEGEIDTFGERVGEAIGAAGSGALRGVRGLLELPETVGSLARMGYQYARGEDIEPLPEKTVAGEAFTDLYGGLASAVGADPSRMEYRGETEAGKFAGKVGEFLPFAGRRVAQYALAPVVAGMAGEKAAKELGFGETGQAVGEIAGMLTGPAAYGGALRAGARAISPYAGADEARLAAAKSLEEKGVSVTSGQKVGSEALQRKEMLTGKGQEMRSGQIEEFTAAVMKDIGSTSSRATADALNEAQNRIGGQMNEALKGVELRPNVSELFDFSDAAKFYRKTKPTGQDAKEAGDMFNKINKAFVNSASTGKPVDIDQYRSFRSQLSKGTVSSSEPIRETSKRMLEALDGAMDRALIGLGRESDIQKLNQARAKYRDYLAIEKSVSKGGETAASGLITPQALGAALRSQGSRAYVQERRGDLGALARAGEQVSVVPKTSGTAENMKQLLGVLKAGSSAHVVGSIASSIGLPYGVGAALGAIGPATFDRLIMTKKGQQYLANQMVKSSEGTITPEYARGIVATLAAQMQTEPQGQ
jgi:hypothetical protein